MVSTKIQCLVCKKYFQFINNTHLKTHSLTIEEYKKIYPGCQLKTEYLIETSAAKKRGKTYEELYGSEAAANLRKLRSENAIKQMCSDEQRQIRRVKCGAPEYYTDERRQNMSNSITDEVLEKRRGTVLKNVEAGKYTTKAFGRQSVQARLYIKEYLKCNSILENLCYFDAGGVSGNEYFVVIQNPVTGRKKTAAYDLVITNDGKHSIDTIIEINGPWHYRTEEVLQDPHGRSCPLTTNKYTKLESYNIDAMKINKALELAKEVYIFWLDNKELIKITEPIKLIKLDE
jgi:hypothetical protein